jgi:membrane protease subunit (stomatin/prohibitin family)
MEDNDGVFLQPASTWTCPACGTVNFCQGELVEFTRDEKEDLAERYDMEPKDFVTGDWITNPEEVVCSNCEEEFPVNGSWFDGGEDNN